MTIKVGQIYQTKNCGKLIIKKHIFTGGASGKRERVILYFENHREQECYFDVFSYESKLLATYDTWQEAVNSKEFKGEKE